MDCLARREASLVKSDYFLKIPLRLLLRFLKAIRNPSQVWAFFSEVAGFNNRYPHAKKGSVANNRIVSYATGFHVGPS